MNEIKLHVQVEGIDEAFKHLQQAHESLEQAKKLADELAQILDKLSASVKPSQEQHEAQSAANSALSAGLGFIPGTRHL